MPVELANAVPAHITRLRTRLHDLREEARTRHTEGTSSLQVASLLADGAESLIREALAARGASLAESERKAIWSRLAVIAVGGTGRGELAPYSDIDLLFLHDRQAPPSMHTFVADVVRDLWDVGVKLGHSVRTVADALAMARTEPQFATALVEARLLTGEASVFEALRWRFARRVVAGRLHEFWDMCVRARASERQQHGSTVLQLEPDVKRSLGGLRDIHLIRWLGFCRYGASDLNILRLQGALTREEERDLIDAQEFLTKIRIEIHYGAGRPQEVLTRQDQLRLAAQYGFADKPGQRGVEQFMQTVFRHSTRIAEIASSFEARERPRSLMGRVLRWMLTHRSNGVFLVAPDELDVVSTARASVCTQLESVLNVFELAGLYGVQISSQLLEHIKRASGELSGPVSSTSASTFLSILKITGRVGRLLRAMDYTRILERVLPEVTHVHCLLQFNQYHKYTVDEHSLRAVEACEAFEHDESPIGEAYRQIRQKALLHLAVFLHDFGKGYEEDHSQVGARIAGQVAERLRLTPSERELLEFLVAKHLAMPHMAFRRDLSDPGTIMRFGREVGSPERLRMLFVLTASDMTAVGPDTWTQWKADLISELYQRTMLILSGEPSVVDEVALRQQVARRVTELLMLGADWQSLADPAFAVTNERGALRPEGPAASAVGGSVLARSGIAITSPEVSVSLLRRLEDFPSHYLTTTSVEDIAADFVLVVQLAPDGVVLRSQYDPATRTVEYRIITRDHPGSALFSRITGVLTAHHLEILSAQICTTRDGVAVDRFRVFDPDFAGEIPVSRRRQIEQAIEDVLRGKTTVEQMFARNQRFLSPRSKECLLPEPTSVTIDHDYSTKFTIIDIFTNDQPGLLYRISKALVALELSVGLAKIGTHVDQVNDVFFVTDQAGQKIAPERAAEIERQLAAAIETPLTQPV